MVLEKLFNVVNSVADKSKWSLLVGNDGSFEPENEIKFAKAAKYCMFRLVRIVNYFDKFEACPNCRFDPAYRNAKREISLLESDYDGV